MAKCIAFPVSVNYTETPCDAAHYFCRLRHAKRLRYTKRSVTLRRDATLRGFDSAGLTGSDLWHRVRRLDGVESTGQSRSYTGTY